MFTAEEATKERVGAYLAALEQEKAGLEARVVRVKDGRPDPVNATAEQLAGRVKDVDGEIKRAKGLLSKPVEEKEPVAA